MLWSLFSSLSGSKAGSVWAVLRVHSAREPPWPCGPWRRLQGSGESQTGGWHFENKLPILYKEDIGEISKDKKKYSLVPLDFRKVSFVGRSQGFVRFSVRSSFEDSYNYTDREKSKYSETNLPQRHFIHHIPYVDWPGIAPGLRGKRPATTWVMARRRWSEWRINVLFLPHRKQRFNYKVFRLVYGQQVYRSLFWNRIETLWAKFWIM